MESDLQERERGITILAKNTAVVFGSVTVDIIHTPGHAGARRRLMGDHGHGCGVRRCGRSDRLAEADSDLLDLRSAGRTRIRLRPGVRMGP